MELFFPILQHTKLLLKHLQATLASILAPKLYPIAKVGELGIFSAIFAATIFKSPV